ncbi:ABC transporter ATP-binding protein, partial [Candidatus Poribacteria bacterium]|nr:ABC transporter ATP-binding protein [Candidatus Poribacteria bacterium]
MTDALLSIRGLRTHFFLDEGTVRAVDGVDLDVRRGRTLGIVGESGCGKSVTAFSILRLVARPGRIVDGDVTLHRDSGRVALTELDEDGPEIRDIRGAEIAMIFQEPMTSLSPVHTVGSQIVEAVRLHTDLRGANARARAVEVLGHVGIPDPATRFRQYPHEMSGGMRQRAMIAMALSCRPSLLIADEPTTALDVTIQAQILELMRDLQAETGMSIMLITHDLGVIAETADEVAVMYLGRVVESGKTERIFDSPQHPYTKGLLAAIPSVDPDRRTEAPPVTGDVPSPSDPPPGCHFHTRCPVAFDRCSQETPGLAPFAAATGVGERSRCFLTQDD